MESEYLACNLCGYSAKSLVRHLNSFHHINSKQYKERFPSEEVVSKLSKSKISNTVQQSFKNGRHVWNRGKTMATDSRIKMPIKAWKRGNISHTQGKTKENYAPIRIAAEKMIGKNNPSKRPEFRELISKANKGRLVGNKNPAKRPEVRKKISASVRRGFANGRKLGTNTPIGNGGWREDIGHFVRSNWEANYARICKLLYKKYQYEGKRFTLYDTNGDILTTYTPDFIHKRIVELKGRGDKRINGEWKIELFKLQYPVEAKKLVFINGKNYKRLKEKFKPRIPNWES